jgi:hypothetical protein
MLSAATCAARLRVARGDGSLRTPGSGAKQIAPLCRRLARKRSGALRKIAFLFVASRSAWPAAARNWFVPSRYPGFPTPVHPGLLSCRAAKCATLSERALLQDFAQALFGTNRDSLIWTGCPPFPLQELRGRHPVSTTRRVASLGIEV